MRQLFDIQQQLLNVLESKKLYDREIFKGLTYDNYATGIIGGRGVGKTTFLLDVVRKNLFHQKSSLYVSADNMYFLQNSLIDLVDQLYKETDVRFLCVDEIHKYHNWEQELKNIVDIYQDFKVLFSGSSMIDIVKAKYDLSRRVTIHRLHGFSFREYLGLILNQDFPRYSFDDLVSNHISIAQNLKVQNVLQHFNQYCRSGYYPFTQQFRDEQESKQALENIIQKVIYEDIAVQLSLKTATLLIMEKIFKYVVNSPPGELNTNKLANLIGKSFDNTNSYLAALQDVGLIKSITYKKFGKSAFKAQSKIYPENSNFMFAYSVSNFMDEVRGKIREIYFLNHFENSGYDVYLSASGDFEVNEYIIDVGGKNKSWQQLKNVKTEKLLAKDNILVGTKNEIPLYLFGFLY